MKKLQNTWERDFNYTECMKNRNKIISEIIHKNNFKSVIDLGCGVQLLKQFLHTNIEYIAVDMYAHLESTHLCDFNGGQFFNANAECCVASGLFEYIYDIEKLLKNVSQCCDNIICSYCYEERYPVRQKIWVNCHTKKEFISFFSNILFDIDDIIERDDIDTIFIFKRK